ELAGRDGGARRRRCDDIVDDERHADRPATSTSPEGCGRDEAIRFVAPPPRCPSIASSARLAAGLVAPATQAALDFFTASQRLGAAQPSRTPRDGNILAKVIRG